MFKWVWHGWRVDRIILLVISILLFLSAANVIIGGINLTVNNITSTSIEIDYTNNMNSYNYIVIPKTVSKTYRMTTYYTNDGTGSTSITGSGLKTNQFQINDKGWYTYNGYLVLAGATYECLNAKTGACSQYNYAIEGRHYFHYYDIVNVMIDGISYQGIILDSCGVSMRSSEDAVDLFVSGSNYYSDWGYKGINPVVITWEE